MFVVILLALHSLAFLSLTCNASERGTKEQLNMETGWIKLHRKLLENPLKTNPLWAWLWVVFLLKANHKEAQIIWNGSPITIKAGQFITGRKELSKDSGIKESTIERVLNYLESGQQIKQEKTNKYRVITIVNWKTYQAENNNLDNKKTTGGQPADTNKNEKKDKKYTPIRRSPEIRNTNPEQGTPSMKELLAKMRPPIN